MGNLVVVAAAAVVFGAIMALLAWLGSRVRRRGSGAGGAFMGPFEEIWHPAAHAARPRVEVVQQRLVPRPSADDQR